MDKREFVNKFGILLTKIRNFRIFFALPENDKN